MYSITENLLQKDTIQVNLATTGIVTTARKMHDFEVKKQVNTYLVSVYFFLCILRYFLVKKVGTRQFYRGIGGPKAVCPTFLGAS